MGDLATDTVFLEDGIFRWFKIRGEELPPSSFPLPTTNQFQRGGRCGAVLGGDGVM